MVFEWILPLRSNAFESRAAEFSAIVSLIVA